MTSSNRIIKGEDVSDAFISWHAPVVDQQTVRRPPPPEPVQDDPAAIRELARKEGFAQGHAEGIAAGHAELAQRAALLTRVLDSLARPLQAMDHRFEEEVLALVTAIARQLVRRELHTDPSHVVSIIREGLEALPAGAVGVRVRLHPQDAELVRELLQPDEAGRAWQIEPDPLMERGGCRIVSETAQIDGRLDTRLARVVATMLEDERAARE